jgi:eukaryotic-like serine/threonine-protein kinase
VRPDRPRAEMTGHSIMDIRTHSSGSSWAEDQGINVPESSGLVVERVVGGGGMGIVYAVRNVETGKRLALKTIRQRYATDAGIVGRFWREIAFAARVMHPNVAPVLGHGRLSDGRPFVLMELYQGRTLGEIVRQDGPLPLARAIDIVDQVLAGLDAVHAAGIVHRDLTPENVFVETNDDGHDRVVLLDFGFAHEPGVDTGDGVTVDSRGALVGTMGFMSPEQMMRGRAITTRSDLFVAAVLLYFSLSGKLPFRGEADVDVMVAFLRRSPVPLRVERRNVPRAIDVLLERALAKHPDARFASASEMRAALAYAGRQRSRRASVSGEIAAS